MVDLNERSAPARYGAILAASMRFGLAALALAFGAYLLFPSSVPVSRMHEIWAAPAADWLALNRMPAGPDWAIHWRGPETLVLAAIAWLASCSIVCLGAVIAVFRARGERIAAVVCALQMAVLVLAALGLLPGTR
jgi:hypothetical protein